MFVVSEETLRRFMLTIYLLLYSQENAIQEKQPPKRTRTMALLISVSIKITKFVHLMQSRRHVWAKKMQITSIESKCQLQLYEDAARKQHRHGRYFYRSAASHS